MLYQALDILCNKESKLRVKLGVLVSLVLCNGYCISIEVSRNKFCCLLE